MMNTTQTTTRWIGRALTFGLIAVAVTARAKKPVQPPPPEPPAPPPITFTILDAGSIGDADDVVSPVAINDLGAIVGTFVSRELWGYDPHYGPIYSFTDMAFLLEPVGDSYFQDVDDDGANDLIQLLPASSNPDDRSWATDINNHGQLIGYREIGSVGSATVWHNGQVVFEMPDAEFLDINDAGAIAGMFWRPQTNGYVESTTFVIVPEDADGDGRPDTWHADADDDGTNDLLYVVQEVEFGAEPMGIFDDMSVLCRDFFYWADPEKTEAAFNPFLSVVRPDFGDADGDGNPWYSDVDGDGMNDLFENFPVNGTVSSATGGGLAAGSMYYSATHSDAMLFDAASVSCIDLDWVDPNARPAGGSAGATAVNDAAWVIGNVYDRKGNATPVFWRDGELWKFGDIASTAFRLTCINQAGVIAGYADGNTGIRVAFPSVSP